MKTIAKTAFAVTMFVGIATPSSAQNFIPSTLFDAHVAAGVDFNKTTRLFTYRYQVRSASSSQQSIDTFGVYYGDSTITNVVSPPGWTAIVKFFGNPIVVWTSTDEKIGPIDPGEKVKGFSFSSAYVPTIRSWHAASSYIYEAQTEEEEREIAAKNLDHFFKNNKSGGVIAPGAPPPSTPIDMISQIERTLDDAERLEWIGSDVLLRSLIAKLDATRASLQRGNRKSATGLLTAFINELEAQRGKKLTPTCVNLLRANAEYAVDLVNR